MKLVSSWSHYLDYQCNDCGETTHVDATRNFPATVACRSSKCRTSRIKLEAVTVSDRPVQIGIPAAFPGCQQPCTA